MSDDESGIGRAVLDLLLALSELQDEDRDGRPGGPLGARSDAHLSVDTGISVGSLDEVDAPGPAGPGGDAPQMEDPGPSSTGSATAGDDFPVRRRETVDGVTIVADVSTRFDGELTATVEDPGDELTVRGDGDVVGRVSLDDGPWQVGEVRHNNGIVEVALRDE